jgi:hypothetical protein
VSPRTPMRRDVSHDGEATPDRIGPLYLQGAAVILDAIGDPQIGEMWEDESVLEGQSVGGLVAHLARGGVWVVGEYLEKGVVDAAVDFDDAVEYYEAILAHADESLHRGVRERSAEIARMGQAGVRELLDERLAAIEVALADVSLHATIEVFAAKVMRLGDYLATRIVEQCVHLDDLSRSLDRHAWSMPEASVELVGAIALDMATRLHGPGPVLRALYRQGFAGEIFPVL